MDLHRSAAVFSVVDGASDRGNGPRAPGGRLGLIHGGCMMGKGNNSQKKEVKKPKKDAAKAADKADKKK